MLPRSPGTVAEGTWPAPPAQRSASTAPRPLCLWPRGGPATGCQGNPTGKPTSPLLHATVTAAGGTNAMRSLGHRPPVMGAERVCPPSLPGMLPRVHTGAPSPSAALQLGT